MKALEAELGKAYKERDDLKRQVEDLRYQLNFGNNFPGDSKELLTAVYKNEYSATHEQIYCAKALLDREYPPTLTAETDEAGRVVCYLPNNRRDPNIENDPNREWISQQLDRQWKAERTTRDEQLRKWIVEGKLCEPCAVLGRTLWKEQDDPEWEPMAPAAPVYIAPPPEIIAPEPRSAANRHYGGSPVPPARPKGFVVLFTKPWSNFQVGIERYGANEAGEILVDEREELSIKLLWNAGCRQHR
jgi:hypothetical protein